MGVLGLWQLLAPVGQPVTLESLENKTLAVDISIWLNQAIKGYRSTQGGSIPNAHLLSLFTRLCKLLFYRIRPIVVFDGGVPELKKRTVARRQIKRDALKQQGKEAGLKLLVNYLANKTVVGKPEGPKPSASYPKVSPKEDIFLLPPISDDAESDDDYLDSHVKATYSFFSKEEQNYLNNVDIDSEGFDALPLEIKQELLSSMKESRRYRTWKQQEEIPDDSGDFSNYQMQNLLKRRHLQKKIEDVQNELRKSRSADIISLYTDEDHVLGETSKIMSEDHSHYILFKKVVKEVEKISNSLTNQSSRQEKDNPSDISNDVNTNIPNLNLRDSPSTNTFVDAEDFYLKSKTSNVETNECTSTIKLISNNLSCTPDQHVKDSMAAYDNKVEKDISEFVEMTDSNFNIQRVENRRKFSSASDSSEDVTYVGQITSDSKPKSLTPDFKEDIHISSINSSSDITYTPDNHVKASLPNATSFSAGKDTTNASGDMIGKNDMKSAPLTSSNSSEETVQEIKNFLTSFKSSKENLANLDNGLVIETENISEIKKVIDENAVNTTLSGRALCETVPAGSRNTLLNADILEERASTSTAHFHAGNAEEHSDSVDDMVPADEVLSSSIEDQCEDFSFLRDKMCIDATALEAEQAKKLRQANSVQDHMYEECQELLQLFGIPYIVSPLEAEAQCAFLDSENVTNGTITDDSDIWLFGGKRVYKNFFAKKKYVEFYKDAEIMSHFGLSRKKLINFALLTGSDYTEGIDGVGRVTALEIISEFSEDGIEALHKFKEWWEISNKQSSAPKNKIRSKLQKVTLSAGFPSGKVFEAYINPTVDDSSEIFSWGRPDLDALRDYTREKFGWSKSKVDDIVLPVIKRLNERTSQTHLDSFFSVGLRKEKELFPSKRIMSALKRINPPVKKAGKDNEVKESTENCAKKGKGSGRPSNKKGQKRKTSNSNKSKASSSKVAAGQKVAKSYLMLSEESSSDGF